MDPKNGIVNKGAGMFEDIKPDNELYHTRASPCGTCPQDFPHRLDQEKLIKRKISALMSFLARLCLQKAAAFFSSDLSNQWAYTQHLLARQVPLRVI